VDDDQLLGRAEQALTEIKVSHGLSEDHAAVLAAIRIRLHGSDGGTLEDMLAAAEHEPAPSLEERLAEVEGDTKKPTLDDLFRDQSG
jgi:hypothetical protein